jgi:hypothetical protein
MPLLKTTSEMKVGYSRLSVNTKIEGLSSYIEDAQSRFIVPLIGTEQASALQTWYDTRNADSAGWPTAEDTKNLALLTRVQKVLTLYTLHLAGPHLVLEVGDKGMMEASVDNATQARMGVLENAASSILSMADANAEQLLEFLEVNKANYTTWDGSDSRKAARTLFVDSGNRMAETIRLVQPRRFFLAALPSIRRVEGLQVADFLGSTLYNALKTALKDGSPTEEQAALIAKLRPYVACLVAADCLPEMNVQMDVDGVRVLSVTDSVKNRTPATLEQVSGLAAKYGSLAAQYQAKALAYLNANAEDFEWTSTLTEDGELPSALPDNATKKSFRL